jgi:hypothetical protein
MLAFLALHGFAAAAAKPYKSTTYERYWFDSEKTRRYCKLAIAYPKLCISRAEQALKSAVFCGKSAPLQLVFSERFCFRI